MTNEEKARKLAIQSTKHIDDNGKEVYNAFVESALQEMAEWKDERVKSCFILISKLIKESVLTKDNPEHIMVEQMMELYNNLKI